MDKLLGGLDLLTANGGRFLRNDDNFIDRISHRYTTFILTVFALVVTTKTYTGDPLISCWIPAEYAAGHFVEYINNICWMSGTYYVSMADLKLPNDPDRKQVINYYQWVPMIFLLQAMLYKLPNIIWQSLSIKSGLDIGALVSAAGSIQTFDQTEGREKIIDYMSRQITDYVTATPEDRHGRLARTRQFLARNVFWCFGRSYGTYLSGVYICVKILYVVNAVGQIFLLNAFIRRDYYSYGFEMMQEFLGNKEPSSSIRFPHVTWCDYKIRGHNVADISVQCVLPINLFNEKIFTFVWFWIMFVAILSSVSFLTRLYRCLNYNSSISYVRTHLKRSRLLDNVQRASEVRDYSRQFALEYLKPDGILLLHLLEENTSQIATVQLLVELWKCFRLSSSLHNVEAQEEYDDETLKMERLKPYSKTKQQNYDPL